MKSDLRIVLTTAVSAICLPSLTVDGDSSLNVSHAVITTPPLLHNSRTSQCKKEQNWCQNVVLQT
jgi:hypothetical protein